MKYKYKFDKKWGLAVGAVSLSLLFALIFTQFPLEIEAAKTRFALWRAGVTSNSTQASPKLHSWVRDLCPISSGTAQSAPQSIVDPTCQCILFLHGLGDDALSFKKILTQATLEPGQAFTLLGPTRLVALDLPWSGESEGLFVAPTSPKHTVHKLASLLAARLPELGSCPRWTVVGNSLGGWIAMWMALESPLINRVALVGSAGLAEVSSRSHLMQPTVESLQEFQKLAYFRPRSIPDQVWKKIAQRAQEKSQTGLSAHLDLSQDKELKEKIGYLRRITMVIWGEADRIIPASEGRSLAAQIPNAAWRLIPECGHMPQKECPQLLLKLINELMGLGAY